MSRNLNQFIQQVNSECESQQIKLILSPVSTIDGCRGYFDEYKRKLVVAIDNPLNLWLQVLVHEFSHLRQYVAQVPIYTRVRTDIGTWLEHHKKHKKTLYKIRDMELDCERRGLKIVDEFKLPICKTDFCRRASSYIHYYNYMLLNPVWCKVPPYSIIEIYESMPTNLRGQYKGLGKFESIYRKYYD